MKPLPHVLILGGGYAGLMAASRILRSKVARVTLIDAKPRFEQRIRMHQVLAGQVVPSPRYRDWLTNPRVQVVTDSVTDINPANRTVLTTSGSYTYDYLLFTLGSEFDRDTIPGAAEHACFIGNQTHNETLAGKIEQLAGQHASIVFAGAGLTSLETATELAERFPTLSVTLISRGPAFADVSETGADYLRGACARLGIRIVENSAVLQVQEGSVELQDGSSIPAELTFVAGGFRASLLTQNLAAALPELKLDSQGRIRSNEDLSVTADRSLWVAGDACHLAGPNAHNSLADGAEYSTQADSESYRMGCVLAMPMGAQAGENIVSVIRGRDTEPFSFGFVFRCISLGRQDALVQWTDADDNPVDKVTTGKKAVRIKEWICKLTYYSPRLELKSGLRFYFWGKPDRSENTPHEIQPTTGTEQYDAG